jgi:predicted glycoside hydrolase/deacetylase ChbG (UPF0249 family)
MPQPETLAARLGHAGERLLIVNCDDLGSSHSANLASLEAMERGVATSGTLMVPCPWAREAAELFRGHDMGVHLTLTAEYPFYRWRSLTGAASLHDDEGYLPRGRGEARRRADPADVRAECRAQIEQALAWGVDVTHLDAHMGVVQVDPRFFEVYLEMAVEFRLPLRMFSADIDERLGFDARTRALAAGVVFPDAFLVEWGRSSDELWRTELPRFASGATVETLVHPVFDGPELRGYDLTEAEIRIDDHAVAVDPQVRAFLDGEGFRRISFRPLRDLQRGDVKTKETA